MMANYLKISSQSSIKLARCVVMSRTQTRQINFGKFLSSLFPADSAKEITLPKIDLQNQTVIREDGSRVSTAMARRELSRGLEGYDTTYDVMRAGLKLGGKQMLGVRSGPNLEWKWLTYEEVLQTADHVGQALRSLKIPTGSQVRIGIYSRNRPEWQMSEIALHSFSNVSVPMYDTMSSCDLVYASNFCDLPLIFVDSVANVKTLLKRKDEMSALKHIIVYDEVFPDVRDFAESKGVNLLTWKQLVKIGRKVENRIDHVVPDSDDIATINFTSGTTGQPKGVILTHRNLVSPITCAIPFANSNDDVMLGYLPLAHIYERSIELMIFSHGGRVGYFRGEAQHIAEDAQSLKPTILPLVPRVLEKIYRHVMAEARKSKVKHAILKLALAYKLQEYKKGNVTTDTLVDRLILRKIQNVLGGNMRLIVVGAAQSSPETINFARAAFGAYVVEGYGQTETSGPATLTIVGDSSVGNVGIPIPSCAVKLADVPELGYFASDNGGEILIKGYSVTCGYFNNRQATQDSFDEDGYIKTGDIGKWTKQGTLQIVDRKKSIFKMPQGKFVAPETIEGKYSECKFIGQLYVHGEPLQSHLVAVIVPDATVLQAFAAEKYGLNDTSLEDLCKDERIKKDIMDNLLEIANDNANDDKLMGYERVADIHLTPESFSIPNGLLTPTQKNKRNKIAEHYKKEIDAMFKKINKKEEAEL